MVYVAALHFKRKEISKIEFTSWMVMWAAAIVVIIFPEILRRFASTFLVTRVFDLMVIGGFVLVISLVSSAYLRTKKMEKKLEDMVRSDAIKQSKKK
jgi:hypothetical protein